MVVSRRILKEFRDGGTYTFDPKKGTPTRFRARIDEDGTKERISAKSGDAIPRAR